MQTYFLTTEALILFYMHANKKWREVKKQAVEPSIETPGLMTGSNN